MKFIGQHDGARLILTLTASLVLAGCNSAESRAEKAYGEYQSAAAANDLPAARRALLQLVAAKDDVADYWAQLGKVQLAMGAYEDAYQAFDRAHELDRSNPDFLRVLTEIALRRGNIPIAQAHARQLDIIAPGDRWVSLVSGHTALNERRFDDALRTSDALLAATPFDSDGTLLKARALIGKDRQEDAVTLLQNHVRAQPADVGSLRLLVKIYERKNDWRNVAHVAGSLSESSRQDPEFALLLIKAELRSGRFPEARRSSFRLLNSAGNPSLTSAVLDLWTTFWPSPQRLNDARKFARGARSKEQKLAYAAFFNRVGSPKDAVALVAMDAGAPVTAANVEANAILADAVFHSGELSAAKTRFDAVLRFDAGNPTALRGRSELRLQAGDARGAISDAQKLVSVLPKSPRDRLLLARCYRVAGNRAQEQRTLWDALQEIPADEHIFAALAATRRQDPDALRALELEFARQRDAQLNQGFV